MNIRYKLSRWLYSDNKVGFAIYKMFKNERASELAANTKFKDMYKGKRCFVLGNGPSLKNEDLSTLANEVVFTVNQFSRHPQAKCVKSNFHFWADPGFFNIDINKSEDRELLESMKGIAADNENVECFFPIAQQDFVKKMNLDKKLHVNYYSPSFPFTEMKDRQIYFDRFAPEFGTVVQNAISLAIYMGFSEIYLLGCDNTGIVSVIQTKMRLTVESSTSYSYTVSQNELKRMKSMYDRESIEDYVKSYYSTLRDYRLIHEYCSRRGVKLVNCSNPTILESIPRMYFKDVI